MPAIFKSAHCLFEFVEGDSSQHHNRDPDKMAEARVDIKKLATFLNGQQVNPSKVICSKYIIFFPPLNGVVYNSNFQSVGFYQYSDGTCSDV